MTDVASAVGHALVAAGVDRVFGVVGSGNFHITNAMCAAGATFVAARHEQGATTMADAYARMSGKVTAVSVHQGCGLTNALTGITEAAKSRTSVVVIAAEATQPGSNFFVDQDGLARSVGAVPLRISAPDTAAAEGRDAVALARQQRRTVLLNLPLEIQTQHAPDGPALEPPVSAAAYPPQEAQLERLVAILERADRPVFIAGRGARGSEGATAVSDLAQSCGALLATSAVAKGLFRDSPWSLDVSGGFATPLAAELIEAADVVVGWGCALNMWTTRHGRLIGPDATVVQVDDDAVAIGAYRDGAIGVLGDVAATARAARERLAERRGGNGGTGYRSTHLRKRIAAEGMWRDVPYADDSTTDTIDPRTLTIALDDLLPRERVISVDSGNFMGYPSMYLAVPDERGFCFTQAYQSIGLGLATAIGAALTCPERLPVAAVGDGGLLMAAAELETVVRLRLPMVILVYNDAAYGAEVHHFAPEGHPLGTVTFPDTDLAAIARGYGFDALTVRTSADLAPIGDWVAGPRDRPLLIDAKITSAPSWWLKEAFGH